MDLWIRSQDKRRLSKIKDIYVVDTDEDVAICGYSSDESDDFDLGIYPTIERALEVLDEIQDELISTNYIPLEEEMKITCGCARIYEMPKE